MYKVSHQWTNAKKTNGYDSKFEASYAQELELRKKAKKIKNWEAQKTIPLIVNGYKICDYRIDFVIYHNDGTTEYVETKGVVFPTWVIKWKLFEALYTSPKNKLTVVFQNSRKKPPKAKKIKV